MPRINLTVTGKNSQPYRFSLDRDNVSIGRASDNDIVVDCPSVSSHHCAMQRVSGGFILRDLSSTNGIKLHGEEMEIIDLKDGMDLFIGDVELEFTTTDEENQALAEENFTPHQLAKPGQHKEEEEKPAKKSKAPPKPAPTTLASAQKSPGFLATLVGIVLALLAFGAGMQASYSSKEKDKGRTDVSLLQDIRDGRPVIESEED
ncbi:MAG: FHA domain-containing protein [Verrucomicrobiales bacterium]